MGPLLILTPLLLLMAVALRPGAGLACLMIGLDSLAAIPWRCSGRAMSSAGAELGRASA